MPDPGGWPRGWASWLAIAVTLGVVVAMIVIGLARLGS